MSGAILLWAMVPLCVPSPVDFATKPVLIISGARDLIVPAGAENMASSEFTDRMSAAVAVFFMPPQINMLQVGDKSITSNVSQLTLKPKYFAKSLVRRAASTFSIISSAPLHRAAEVDWLGNRQLEVCDKQARHYEANDEH